MFLRDEKHSYLADIDAVKIEKLNKEAVPILDTSLIQMVLKNSSYLLLFNEWGEFRSPNFEEKKRYLKFPIIFEGRNQYNTFNLEKKGFEYYQIGKK